MEDTAATFAAVLSGGDAVGPLGGLEEPMLRIEHPARVVPLHRAARPAPGRFFVDGHPDLLEGYGRPVAEALARGCPVVTSRGTATEEVAGGLARLVDPADLDALYAACRQALDSPRPAPRQGLRRNDDVARDYLDLFREAVHANLPRK